MPTTMTALADAEKRSLKTVNTYKPVIIIANAATTLNKTVTRSNIFTPFLYNPGMENFLTIAQSGIAPIVTRSVPALPKPVSLPYKTLTASELTFDYLI